ncbi:MAG: MFS transporter [Paracoccaceae bacterium]
MEQPTDIRRFGTVHLPLIVVSRATTTAIYMTYPACLSVLLIAWQMTATQAGMVQGAFSLAFAISLLVSSFACDRFGAIKVFHSATLAVVIASFLVAIFARSFESALVCLGLLGLAQGGTYTSSIIAVSANVAPTKKGAAVGWVLAGMSAGYVVSIFLASALVAVYDYGTAFAVTGALTVFGWVSGVYAMRNARDPVLVPGAGAEVSTPTMTRRARLLTLGYIGHCWELFGMWAWVPAFLAAAVLVEGSMSAIELGLWTAVTLHVTGFFSSFLSGYGADRFGARKVLIFFAALGAVCSFSVGWLFEASVPVLFVITAIYGFAAIGDSSVLSSAMTDAVPAARLGRALGVRSILGIGTGAAAPIVFGAVLDGVEGVTQWGYAFSALSIGGLLALVCAVALRR